MEGCGMILLLKTCALPCWSTMRGTLRPSEGFPDPDPVPLLKLFNPCGSARWLVTELDEDGDTMFGLADLGFGTELGSFSLSEIQRFACPSGLPSSAMHFRSHHPMSIWVDPRPARGSIDRPKLR
jgi:hypothetical protein